MMAGRRALILVCVAMVSCAVAQSIDSELVKVSALGEPGAYTGFQVESQGAAVATVTLGSNGAITAKTARVRGGTLRLAGLRCVPTPTLGASSFVDVSLVKGSPYPQVRFALDLRRFDQDAWEAAFGEVPFHFLVCSVPGAEVFHQRGWPIGTPVIDDYIQMKAEGFGKQVVSSWSRDWTYAPPIGAYPLATAGLWNPSKKGYVAYDFHGARLTDHTEKNFGTAYCYECKDSKQFFCLTWPYGKRYINLRYPETPVSCGTHFRLLWSTDIGPDDDPNRFVNEFIWDTYKDLLPDVERMNDLSWLPNSFRISGFEAPGNLGDFVTSSGDEPRWWAPNVHLAGGVGYFSPVDYYYDTDSRENIEKLAAGCQELVKLGKWMEVDGDRCYAWQTPLDGGGADFFGRGVETFRHVQNWYSGLALLDYYRNDPEAAKDMLPYLDGVLRWTKHTLYTRNGYPDVPAAQFAWSATPCVTFCLRYYYHFRDDETHKDLADLAYKLARNMTYRYLAIWASDNDEMDDLDSSFTMEPNAGLNWLGSACANEIWVYNIAMLYEYVATGDPIMGHYLRGMLERYHEMFQDQWYPTVQEYGGAFTERFGFFDECAQGKGVRGSFGGLWGGFERLIWPVGEAKARVVCGEKAAMCFNRDGRHTDIKDYRSYGNGSFSFTLTSGGLQADDKAKFDLTVTFPFFDLRGRKVLVVGNGQDGPVTAYRIRRGQEPIPGIDGDVGEVIEYAAEPSTITLKGVKLGDTVTIGETKPNVDPLPCAIAKPRTMPSADGDSFVYRGNFKMLNLMRGAHEGISRDWTDLKSFAGYESGIKTLYGVPFLLLDPDLSKNMVQVPRGGIAYGEKPEYLFLLIADAQERSRLTLYRGGQDKERIDLSGAVPVIKGWPPVLGWHIDLVMVENKGRPILSIAPTGCKIFSITSIDRAGDTLTETLAAISEQREAMVARRAMVKRVAELAPLFEPFSGHIGVLPVPGETNPRSNPVVRMLHEAGLVKHVRILSPEDLVNPRVFNSKNIWISLYLAGENYYQTVNTEGDGDEALRNWIGSGGTLVCLGSGPFPFYYNESDKPVVSAPTFGLPISGSGAGDRMDTLDVAPITGWETVPDGLTPSFEVNPDQKVLTSLPATIPWSEDADPRWRPIFNVVDEGNVYTPLVTLKDQDGKKYGEAAAMIDYKVGDLAGGRVIYIWHSLRTGAGYEREIITDLFRYLLTDTLQPIGEYTCIRAAKPPVIDGKLNDEVWKQAESTTAFIRFDPDKADGKSLRTTAKMAWDDGALYVAWECEDPDVWSTITQRDGDLWEGEVVEVYVDPDGDGENYKEFEISPLNTVIDLNIGKVVNAGPEDLEKARSWDAAEWISTVQIDGTLDNRDDKDKTWTAETAIPLRNFTTARNLPPRMGDAWRAQLLRIERSNSLDKPQFSAWSATNTFHNPARFGRILFAGNPYAEDFMGYEPGQPPTPTWTVTSGEWSVSDWELLGKNSGTGGFLPTGIITGSEDWTDYRLSLRFRVQQTGSDHRDGAWIGFRYKSAEECYSLNVGGGKVTVNKAYRGRTSGDLNYLVQKPWQLDDKWHRAVITVRGATITVELDGTQVIEATDEEYLGVAPVPSGGICLSARRWENSTGDTVVRFDDVTVEPL